MSRASLTRLAWTVLIFYACGLTVGQSLEIARLERDRNFWLNVAENTAEGFSEYIQAHRADALRLLVFPHGIKLSASNDELIDRNNGEYASKYQDAPFGDGAAFRRFARSHKALLFIISLGLGCIGNFFLFFGGYHFAIRQPNLRYLLLCALLGTFAFALVFALAHASYAVQNTGLIPSSHIS